jgi:hypothetical protein
MTIANRLLATAVIVNLITAGAVARSDEDIRSILEWLRYASQHLAEVAPRRTLPRERDEALAALPIAGDLAPDGSEARKLAALSDFLHLADPSESFVLKLIDLRYAAVRIYARFVLLISRPAIRLLSSEELNALSAHELAHRYFWDQYYSARARNASNELVRQELLCDAIAVLTLHRLAVPSHSLVSALQRVDGFNSQFGVALDTRWYPTTSRRERLVEAVVAMLGSSCTRAVAR